MLQRGSTIGSVLGGLVAATDLQTTYAGSGLKVEAAAGECIVPGHAATQSGYYFRNTTGATFTPAAANGSNPRIEHLVARVYDEAYEGAKNEGKLELLEGTAKAGATLANLEGAAATPNSALSLAYVLIPAKATTISNSEIKNVAEPVQLAIITQPASGQVYGSLTTWTSGTEYEPSATRATLVVLNAGITGTGTGSGQVTVEVGGVTIAEPKVTVTSTVEQAIALAFIVPAGKKWKATVALSSATSALTRSYLPL